MDNYILYLLTENGKRNITELVGNLSWSDDIDTLGVKLSFDFVRNKNDKYLVNYDIINVGDKILLFNDTVEVFRGIIVGIDKEKLSKSCTAFDYAFYLNKSETVIQFYKQSASEAIRKVCGEFGVNVSVDSMSTNIAKIYKDKTIGSIIADIIDQVEKENGKSYFYEMKGDTLHILEIGFETITATYKPAVNIAPINVADAVGEYTISESIEDMKNAVVVTSNEEKDARVIATASNSKDISKYGLLQEVITVDKKNMSEANNIAKNELKKLNMVKKEISVPLLGSDKIKCGRKIEFKEDDLNGTFLIKTSTHTIANGIHECTVDIEVI